MSLNKYKILLFLCIMGFFSIFSIVNYKAFYNVVEYTLFAIVELMVMTLTILFIVFIYKLDHILYIEGYTLLSEHEILHIRDEDINETIRKIEHHPKPKKAPEMLLSQQFGKNP